MHFIVIAIGTAGDVYPLLGLSRAMAASGHRVSFCTSPFFQEIVERSGLRFLPLGTVEQYRSTVDDPALWKGRTSLKTLWSGVTTTIRPLFQLLYEQVDNETVLAGHPWSFGARLLQEKYGVPLITLQVSPSTFLSARHPPVHKQLPIPKFLPYPVRASLLWAFERGILDRLCAPDINKLRNELELPPIHRVISRWMHSPQGVVGLFPEWFAPVQADWPAGVRLTGFPLFDDSDGYRFDEELEDFLSDGHSPILFTHGSTMVDSVLYTNAAATAVDEVKSKGIILSGQAASLPELSPNLLIRSYVPFSKILPRAKAIVHHGGIGTVAQALAAGVPQLITPYAHDQHDNAERVERLGCGLQLESPVTGQTMTQALRRLMGDVGIHHNCMTIRSHMEREKSPCKKAVIAIEELAKQALENRMPPIETTQQQDAATA